MKSLSWAGLGLMVVAVSASCSGSGGASATCGQGTMLQGSQCVASAAGVQNSAGGSSDSSGDGGKGGTRPEAGSAGANVDAGTGGEPGLGDSDAGSTSTSDAGSAGNSAGSAGNGVGGSGASDGLITTALDCGSRDVTGATVLTEPITQDTAWSGVIHLPNGMSVRNEPTLTIAPGTKVIVGHNAGVEFGYLGSRATIVANGTIDKPIKFCGEAETAGYWAGLIFRGGIKSASVLRNVLVADGGATGAGLTMEMPLLVQGVQVRNSGSNGVNSVGFAPSSSGLLVTGAKNLAVRATAPKGIEVPLGSQLTGNGTDVIDVGFASFDTDLTFRDLGVPYQQLLDLKEGVTSTAPTVTFEPGVIYEVDRQKVLDFGTATVHVLGSMAKPVIFERLPCTQVSSLLCLPSPPATLDIGGRMIAAGPDLRFENVEIRRFGWVMDETTLAQTTGALTINGTGTLKVDHLKFTGASGYGLSLAEPRAFSADSNNLEIALSRNYAALLLGCSAVASLPVSVKLSGPSTFTRIVNCYSIVTPNTIWQLGASPYFVSTLNIASGASLTLQPGVKLQFVSSTALNVQSGGSLKAIGTPEAPIRFVRSTTLNNTENWAGIVANTGSTVQLDNIEVREAGSSGAAITANVPIQLNHSTIIFSAGAGLKKAAADTTDYLTGNTFTNNAGADIVTLP